MTKTTKSSCGPIPDEDLKKGATIGDKRRWSASGDFFYGLNSTYGTLPSALYKAVVIPNVGPALEKQKVETDGLIEFPDTTINEVIAEFEKFWSEETVNEFKSRKLLHKRGILLHGPPGSGKTSCIQILTRIIHEKYKGLTVMIDDPEVAAGALHMVRRIEENRPLVVVIEDIDAMVDRYDESDYLRLLDGEEQVDHVFYVATSNYPQKLDRRFLNRPSRFDSLIQIDMPSRESRKLYLLDKEPSFKDNPDELEKWLDSSRGFSIAHLKELIVAVKCLNADFDWTIDRLEKMRTAEIDSKNYEDEVNNAIGFTPRKPKYGKDD